MSKQPKIHSIYTLQVKAKGTQQFGQEQVDEMMTDIADTVKNWFPKGDVEFEKVDVSDGSKRVVVTNVLPERRRSVSKAKAVFAGEVPYSYTTNAEGVVDSLVGDVEAAERDGVVFGKKAPEDK